MSRLLEQPSPGGPNSRNRQDSQLRKHVRLDDVSVDDPPDRSEGLFILP